MLFFAHRLCSLLRLRVLRYLPLEKLRVKNDDLESDIFKPRLGEPHSVHKAEKVAEKLIHVTWEHCRRDASQHNLCQFA